MVLIAILTGVCGFKFLLWCSIQLLDDEWWWALPYISRFVHCGHIYMIIYIYIYYANMRILHSLYVYIELIIRLAYDGSFLAPLPWGDHVGGNLALKAGPWGSMVENQEFTMVQFWQWTDDKQICWYPKLLLGVYPTIISKKNIIRCEQMIFQMINQHKTVFFMFRQSLKLG